jgi:uncharacterized protein (DUF2147 family)
MKNILFSLVLILMSPLVKAQSQGGSSINGIWLDEAKDAKIEIYQSGNKFFGKLIWGTRMSDSKGNMTKDVKNPHDKLKSRALNGLVTLKDFIYANGEWKDGTIYDPDNGKTYKATMKFKDKQLSIRGYVGISLFGRTSVWTRAEN